jgi:hypothetical protein
MPVKSDDFGLDADLFPKLPGGRGGERLAGFDVPAGQAEMAEQRRPRLARDERLDFRNIAAETARMGRVGTNALFMCCRPRPPILSRDRSQLPGLGRRSTLSLTRPRAARLARPKSEKPILQQVIYECQKLMLYLCLSPGSSPRHAGAGRTRKGRRRFERAPRAAGNFDSKRP